MPRQRLRPDYWRRNYTYDCQILGSPPQAVWDTAHAMQTLWNGLVSRHDALVEPWDAETTRETKQAGYTAFWQDAYLYIRDEGERLGLSCWPKWHVYETFQAAQRKWAKHQGGKPTHHQGLTTVFLPHRTASGGVPASWVFSDTPSKHTALVPPSEGHHHHTGYTTVGDVRVPLRLMLHRPFQDEAILKRMALLGTFEPSFRTATQDGWQWRMQFSIEIPPEPPAEPVGRSAGMDLGWRVREDGMRLAVVTDGTRCWEWLLPWDMSNNRLRRRQAWAAVHGLTVDTSGSWRAIWRWQTELDTALEACKIALRALDKSGWPDEAHVLWQSHVKMRVSGLRRLARALYDAGMKEPVLDDWLTVHTLRQRRLRGAQLRLLRQRNYLYRLLADWLARHFDVVSWEGDLGLKDMAETVTDKVALEEAKKYRHMAGLSILRNYIREALAKRGRTLLGTEAAYTTQRCSVEGCDGVIVPSAALELQCSNGHFEDTDINAATVLWREIPHALRSTSRVMPTVDHAQLQRAVHRLA